MTIRKHRAVILTGAIIAAIIIAGLTAWNYAGADMTTPRTPLPIPTQFGVAAGRAGATALYLPGRGDSTYQIQYRLADQTPVDPWTLTSGVAGVHHLALSEGMTYDIRVRTVSAAGIAGDWSDAKTIVAGPQTEPVPDAMVTQELAVIAREQATEQFVRSMSPPRTPGHLRYGVIQSSAVVNLQTVYQVSLYAGAGAVSQTISATEPGDITWLTFRRGQDVWVQHVGSGLWEVVVPADHLREAFYGGWQILSYTGVDGGGNPTYSWAGAGIPGSPSQPPEITVTGGDDRTGWRPTDRILADFFASAPTQDANQQPAIRMFFRAHANIDLMLREIDANQTAITNLNAIVADYDRRLRRLGG